MSASEYDVVIIGSGPAGEGAAMNAAKYGKRVAMVEAYDGVGGACTHKGTIPSKALRHSVKQIIEFNTNPMFRDVGEPRWFSFPRVLKNAEQVIAKQVTLRTEFYSRNRVDLFFGQARFIDENHIEVQEPTRGNETLRAKDFIIATGSSPYRPDDVDFSNPRIYDSDTILNLSHTPRNLIIYGAGVIGCEYASIFAGLGVKVDLVTSHNELLSFLDDEIGDALSYHLRDNGVMLRLNEEYEHISADDRFAYLDLKSGKRLKADAILWCNGRTGNTRSLGLENVGLCGDGRGRLEVNDQYQTSVPNIYAAGDVVGWPSLASAAYDQGCSSSNAILDNGESYFVTDVANGIYTIPEISSVGATEEELTAQKIPYEVGRALFKNTARAQIAGETVGMLKLLFHVESHALLGIHCFGDRAAEIIHIGQAIMNQKDDANTIRYFTNTTFNYPTMAEAYRVAALDGLNRLV
ncbi:MAG: Si-specific NAD(P)(+) transhydrogenase [Pseudomonadales bacterium]|nr:Si-specific NAD(P)(+) transhydrogenase [Pseudomonadales bacterium]